MNTILLLIEFKFLSIKFLLLAKSYTRITNVQKAGLRCHVVGYVGKAVRSYSVWESNGK